ncbi:MAG: SH3 domain-containing protein [Firmicutes bacterium]|nr:SH3 domain-containing protein [Bacillota bacterium]
MSFSSGARRLLTFTVVLALALILSIVLMKASDDVVYADTTLKYGVVNDGPLNVRSGPGTSYKSYGSLQKGKAVTVRGTSGKWYIIRFNSKKGYVHSDFITLKKGYKIIYSSARYGFVKKSVAVRSKASASSSKYGTIKAGKIIRRRAYRVTKDGTKWYQIKYSGKTAYVSAGRILKVTYKVYNPAREGRTKDPLNYRTGPATYFGKKGTISEGKKINIYSRVKANGEYWYRIKRSGTYYWVCAEYVKLLSSGSTGGDTTTTTDFVADLKKQGFPYSYRKEILKLHKKHPKWRFRIQKTNIKWSKMLNAENELGQNLVEPTEYESWKTLRKGAYDFGKNRYVSFDGRWNQASKEVIAYFLDPRNGLTENNIYQFMGHKFNSKYQNKKTIKSIVSSVDYCFMNTESYIKCLYNAGKGAGVNPNVITAMVVMEQGWKGGSGLISGKVKGYEGIYNHFNIGAYTTSNMSAVIHGLWWAKGAGVGATTYGRPWTSRTKSLKGGALFYKTGYIDNKQNTYYLKKFNAMNGDSYLPKHQYSTAVFAAQSEGKILKRAYQDSDDYPMIFYVPVYKDMPSEKCRYPVCKGNNDYYLKSLNVKGYSKTPSFDRYKKTYRVSVPSDVSKVEITAKAHNSEATITGTGTVSLKKGENTKYVKVRSTSGKTRKYKLIITRK